MNRIPEALIFDRDGTLFDSLQVILNSFQYGIEPFASRKPADKEWIAAFGPPEPEVMAKFIDPVHMEAAFARFMEYYTGHAHQLRLFPGMYELLKKARIRGIRLALFTGAGIESTRFCLRQAGILSWFDALITGDRVEKPKPDPEGILLALRLLNATSENSIVIGDSVSDVIAGQKAGTTTVLAKWSSYLLKENQLATADHEFDSVAEFAGFLEI